MAVAIRLARHGSKKRPFYRVVAAEKRSPRDGRFIELLGTYDPRAKQIRLDQERYQHWLSCGAQASPTVAALARRLAREAAAEEVPVTAENVSTKAAPKAAEPVAQAPAAAPAEASSGAAGPSEG